MIPSERIQFILQQLHEHKIIHVKTIAEQLDISESTIRRDFINLEKEGKLNRVHGGAVLGDGMSIYNTSKEIYVTDRTQVNWEIKTKIAQAITKNIEDHQCIFIDGGSSLAPLAELLSQRDISIVTNNVLFLQNLYQAKASVYFLGGQYLDKYHMTMGSVASEQLSMFNFDAAFISCSGVSFEKEIAYTAELSTNIIKQQVMKQSLHSYLVLDDSKIEMIGFCSIASLHQFSGIYCNQVDDVETTLENMIWV